MATPTLKPCPLCGMPVGITETFIGTMYRNFGTLCQDISAEIECPCGLTYKREWIEIKRNGAFEVYPTCEDITTAWNRRANDEA